MGADEKALSSTVTEDVGIPSPEFSDRIVEALCEEARRICTIPVLPIGRGGKAALLRWALGSRGAADCWAALSCSAVACEDKIVNIYVSKKELLVNVRGAWGKNKKSS